MKTILLILIGLSVVSQAERFTRDATTMVVTDAQTNLQWQDEEYTQAEQDAYNNNTESGKVLDWTSAITYCEDLTFGGKDDWRLPNFNELYYIADRTSSPALLDPALSSVFVNVISSAYWSSTTHASDTNSAWVVVFSNGGDNNVNKTYSVFVRCVRAGQ